MEKISLKFLDELFLLCLNKKDIIEIVVEHLKYQYIPEEFSNYKKILKSITTIYKNSNQLPTIGIISQQHQSDLKVQEALNSIKEAQFGEKDIIISTLENFIKKSKFVQLNDKLATLYSDGKHDEAIDLQFKESGEISSFSLKQTGTFYSRVYKDFNKRLINRKDRHESGESIHDKVLFGIDPLDRVTYGGVDVGDTVLWILRSGIGKSTAMKWNAISAVRKHRNVLHIQLEGTRQETEDKYDQIWSACLYNDIKKGNINDERYKKLQEVINYMSTHNSDIYIHAFEQFNTASMMDVRNLICDFEKVNGHIDEIIIDYLKYLHPGDGVKYGADTQSIKMKKETTSEKIKNLAVEFGTRIITADQASDVPMEIWNDPAKVLTRHNISGAKNLPDSYSYVFTGNQTNDERKSEILRIHTEKLRNYPVLDKPIKVATNYNFGRFYDHRRTQELYLNKTANRYEF